MELAPAGINGKKLFNYRPMLVAALGLMAGIACCMHLNTVGAAVTALILAVLAGVLFFWLRKRRLALFVLAAVFGLMLAYAGKPTELAEGRYTLTGTVTDTAQTDDGQRLILRSAELDGRKLNMRVQLTVKDGIISIGDSIRTEAYCRMPSKRFGSYDELRSMLASGIGCIASADEAAVTGEHKAPLSELLCTVRGSIEERIRIVFGDDSGLFTALILGQKTEVGEERYSAYRASGTAHLLALSGFHMGIVAGAVSLLIPKRKKNLRLAVISAVMLVYCTVAAYAPGFVRAGIMTFCYLMADRLERRPDTLSSLSTAAVLILIVNPFQLYSVGFQLSFSACFGIALLAAGFNRGLERISMPKGLVSAISVSAAAIIGTLPFQMHYFGSFTPYAVICNLIAVPAFSLIVILGLILTVLGFFLPSAASLLAVVPRAVLFVIEKLLGFFSNMPYASVSSVSPPLFGCAIFLAMLFFYSEYTLRPFKKRMWVGTALLVLFTFSCFIGIIKA